MKKIIFLIIPVLLLCSCNNSPKKEVAEKSRIELIPEPDKEERLKYEEIQKLKNSNCILENPDVSVSGIEIGNSESTILVVGDKDKSDENGDYHYYSKKESETLTLTQHPGDVKFQISIFKIEKSSKASLGYRELNFESFKTEKGIKLGMTKKEIVEKLGNCYLPVDSTASYIELFYSIESPKDNKIKLLEKHNMPKYYASYKFYKNRLEKYEFGFEYP